MRGRDVFQGLMIGLGTLALAALFAGLWYWGYTGSEAVPLEVQQPILVLLISFVASVTSGTLIYGLTLRTLRRNPGSRLLGWVWLLIIFVPTIALALVARSGGPRISGTVLLIPMQGCFLGWALAAHRWRSRAASRAQASMQEQPSAGA